MKKLLVVLLSVLMVVSMTACGEKEVENKDIDTLTISFVPSKDSEVILKAANGQTEEQIANGYRGLGDIIKEEMAKKGYTINNVDISVGIDYAATGEGMISGVIDIGLIPASTYTLYHEDGAELLVEALRWGVAGDDASVVLDPSLGIQPWNDCEKTQDATSKATGYASLVYVNIATEKGADLYAKATAGTLTWEDVDSAKWYVCSATSSAGYIYPSLWLNQTFGEGVGAEKKTVANLSHLTANGSYTNMMGDLLAGNCDVTVGYADVRKDGEKINTLFEAAYAKEVAEGKYENIWDIIKVIAVSDYIMNDTVSYSKVSENMQDPAFVTALQEVFIALGETAEGQAAVKPYSHMGYTLGKDSDYDATREANKLFD